MMRFRAALLLPLIAVAANAADGRQVVVDFEDAILLLTNDKANRVEQWVEKGVVFKLAHEPRKSKTKGMLGFFPHIDSGRKGMVCAMAMEPIPVRATFPTPVSSVTIVLWGSTGTPALLEAFDSDGTVVDRAKLESAPSRKGPGDPVPTFTLTVTARRIAYIEFSGPREGEYLAADEVRFKPIENDDRHQVERLLAKEAGFMDSPVRTVHFRVYERSICGHKASGGFCLSGSLDARYVSWISFPRPSRE